MSKYEVLNGYCVVEKQVLNMGIKDFRCKSILAFKYFKASNVQIFVRFFFSQVLK